MQNGLGNRPSEPSLIAVAVDFGACWMGRDHVVGVCRTPGRVAVRAPRGQASGRYASSASAKSLSDQVSDPLASSSVICRTQRSSASVIAS